MLSINSLCDVVLHNHGHKITTMTYLLEALKSSSTSCPALWSSLKTDEKWMILGRPCNYIVVIC